MNAARLAGTHTLPDGSTAEVTINGRTAEVRGSRDGEATFTVSLSVSRVSELLGHA